MESFFSVATFAICVWILLCIGAKMPQKVSNFNKKAKRTTKNFIKSIIDD